MATNKITEQNKKILIIEDEEDQRMLLADKLAMQFPDITIHEATDFDQAQQMMDRTNYNVIISDLLIGQYNFKDEIKSISQGGQSKVIVYTVAPELFPGEYVDHKTTFVCNKLHSFDEEMVEILKGMF